MTEVSTLQVTREATSRLLSGAEHIHFHRAGDGRPLLMLHGSGPGVSGWANFGPTVQTFARDFSVLIPDLPGYGESFQPRMPAPYLDLAVASILRLMDAQGFEKADIIGNSLGGTLAVQLTLDHPDRVDRLVLMGPGGVSPALLGPLPTEGIRLLIAFCEDPTRERLVEWMRSMVGDQSYLTEDRIEERWQSVSRPGGSDFIREFMRSVMPAPGEKRPPLTPLWTRLGEIEKRTLLTYGRDDRVTPLEGALYPLHSIRDAELHVFPNCGHWAMQERQEAFESVVTEFLLRDRSN